MEITMNNIATLVRDAINKEFVFKTFSNSIYLYKDSDLNYPIIEIIVHHLIKQLEIKTSKSEGYFPLTESDYNLFKVLLDEISEYNKYKIECEFSDIYNELTYLK